VLSTRMLRTRYCMLRNLCSTGRTYSVSSLNLNTINSRLYGGGLTGVSVLNENSKFIQKICFKIRTFKTGRDKYNNDMLFYVIT
jgi:hypothetical protein